MKYIHVFILSVSLILFYTGCDSVTDSKSESVTAPTLTSPANNDTMVSLTATFQWSSEGDKLQIDQSAGFTGPMEFAVSANSMTIPAGNLSPGTYYYWRVGKTLGGTVYWSNSFYFRTRP